MAVNVLISSINCEDKAKLSLLFHTGEKTDGKNEDYMYLKINHQWHFNLQEAKVKGITCMTCNYNCQQDYIISQSA